MKNSSDYAQNLILEHKRYILSMVIVALWVVLGLLGIIFKTPFYNLSVYFLSLTGFVGAYLISEGKKPTSATSIFRHGRSSTREILIYVVTALWMGLGSVCTVLSLDLLQAAAYFGALTPYVSTYLLGVAYLPSTTPQNVTETVTTEPAIDENGNQIVTQSAMVQE
jgi:hypothetical protein